MGLFENQLKPLLRIGLAFVLVWFYYGMTTGYLTGVLQFLAVVFLAFGTWIIIFRIIFPAEPND